MSNTLANASFSNQGTFVGQNTQNEPLLEYPAVPPQDHQLKNDLQNATLVDAGKTKQTLLFCYICDIPMNVRVALDPCKHIVCYSCYCQFPNECKMCEEEIKSFFRIPDDEKIAYTEDDLGYPIYKPKAEFKISSNLS